MYQVQQVSSSSWVPDIAKKKMCNPYVLLWQILGDELKQVSARCKEGKKDPSCYNKQRKEVCERDPPLLQVSVASPRWLCGALWAAIVADFSR